MTLRKLSLPIVLVLVLSLLSACQTTTPSSAVSSEASSASSEAPPSSAAASSAVSSASNPVEPEEKTAILYADRRTNSTAIDELLEEYDYIYTGELTADMLAVGLSELTGLFFYVEITPYVDEDPLRNGLQVDWHPDSTLLAGPVQDENLSGLYHFYDADSLSWFMMNSLWETLSINLGEENIYYTMNGGEPLDPPGVASLREWLPFDTSIPFFGSLFYDAHSNVKGD